MMIRLIHFKAKALDFLKKEVTIKEMDFRGEYRWNLTCL